MPNRVSAELNHARRCQASAASPNENQTASSQRSRRDKPNSGREGDLGARDVNGRTDDPRARGAGSERVTVLTAGTANIMGTGRR